MRPLFIPIALVAVALLLAACGGDDDAPSTPTGGTQTASGQSTSSTDGGGAVGAAELQGTLVFISDRAGTQDVWVMNADGSDPRNLTNSPEAEAFPEWSPDGTRIAFQRGLNIWVMNEDGSDQQEVLASASDPSWFPDGELLAVVLVAGQETDLGIVRLSDGEVTRLTESPGIVESYPAWSPDGSQILYFSNKDQKLGLYAWDVEAGSPSIITDDQSLDVYAAWSPDGSRVAYAHPVAGIQTIVTMAPDGSDRKSLTPENTWDTFPAYSPDGCCIAFLSTRVDRQSDIFVMRTDGTGARRITDHPKEDGIFGIDWKAD